MASLPNIPISFSKRKAVRGELTLACTRGFNREVRIERGRRRKGVTYLQETKNILGEGLSIHIGGSSGILKAENPGTNQLLASAGKQPR